MLTEPSCPVTDPWKSQVSKAWFAQVIGAECSKFLGVNDMRELRSSWWGKEEEAYWGE